MIAAARLETPAGARTTLRVALVTDTHGFLDPRIASAVARHDVAVHAGDVGPGVLEVLRPRSGLVVAVRGNNDTPAHWARAGASPVPELPESALLALPGGTLAVVHGDRAGRPAVRHDRLRRDFATARAVVYGHSHHQVVDRSGRPWVLNPGASGRARTFGGPGYLSLRAGPTRWTVRAFRLPPLPRGAR